MLRMVRIESIHSTKTPKRIHFLREWAERRDLRQVDFVKELDANKGTVSRWFAGSLPEQPCLLRICAMFHLEEPTDLFRHPDDNWFTRFFADRSDEERKRMIQTLEAAFPKKKRA